MNRQRRWLGSPDRPRAGTGAHRSLTIGALAGALLLSAFTWPWEVGGPWPTSSREPVEPLARPDVEEQVPAGASTVRFAVYGDQRALADGEWQELIAAVERKHAAKALDFVIDTGDIVQDGRHTDQFTFLEEILRPIDELPYLVAVGNHEVTNNADPRARAHTATFLADLDPALSPDRLYFRKDLGPCRFLFLDSNDLVYGDGSDGMGGDTGATVRPGSRVDAQMRWLRAQLAEPEPEGAYTIVAIHHPLVQSSAKHREQSVELWQFEHEGVFLRDMLADAGVDLLLVGHTHTYERFVLERQGRRMHLVNLSGRPRTSFLWIGDGARRARDIRERETEWLTERGWELDGWRVRQASVMEEDERNQFAVFEIEAGSEPRLTVYLLDDEATDGVVELESVTLE